jgi:ribonuclease Z
MADTFQARLVNGPFEDPALYVDFRYARRAFLFDLGNIDGLSTREILRISDIFVSHTHIDHFIGFDYLLRCSLNRDDPITFFGPKGIIDNIKGKLAAYTWNWIQEYPIKIIVHEIDDGQGKSIRLNGANRFEPDGEAIEPFNGILLGEHSLNVACAILDHSIPCLAFSLTGNRQLNIRSDRLQTMGLKSGPWLDQLKKMVREEMPLHTRLAIPDENGGEKDLTLEEWRNALILESEGQKIAYVVDCLYSPANVEQIVSLARDADLFYCEASFSETDKDKAVARYHLTSRQAGTIARTARVKNFIPFHFSHRYETEPNRLWDEAMESFATAEENVISSL